MTLTTLRPLCSKVSPDGSGKTCERDKNHSGYCWWHEGSTYHTFQPGWIDQGRTPKRRNFLTMVVCFAFFAALPIIEFQTMGWTWGLLMSGLILSIPLIGGRQGLTRLANIWREYRREAKGLTRQ